MFAVGLLELLRGKLLVILVVAGSLLIGPFTYAAPALSEGTDLGGELQLQASGMSLNRYSGTFDSVLALRNTSTGVVGLPLSAAVLSLPSGVILSNATAVTSDGVPFITLDQGLPLLPGTTRTVVLKFVNRTNARFPNNLRVVRFNQALTAQEVLQGPDQDGNGVRDDLEPMLDQRYKDKPALRNAVVKLLKNWREGLAVGAEGTADQAFSTMKDLNRTYECVGEVMGSLDSRHEESKYLEGLMLNTRERVTADITLMNKLAGKTIRTFSNPCGNP